MNPFVPSRILERVGEKCGPVAASRRGPVQKYLGCPRCGRPGRGGEGQGAQSEKKETEETTGGKERAAGPKERRGEPGRKRAKLAEREKDARKDH